jgi:hypothetical protein
MHIGGYNPAAGGSVAEFLHRSHHGIGFFCNGFRDRIVELDSHSGSPGAGARQFGETRRPILS